MAVYGCDVSPDRVKVNVPVPSLASSIVLGEEVTVMVGAGGGDGLPLSGPPVGPK